MTIKQLFIGKTDDSRIQIVRNAIVESIRIGVNALVLFLMTDLILGADYLEINTLVASMLSGLLNFALSTIWVFHKRQKSGNILRFIVFTLIGAVGLGLNVGITSLLTKICGIHYLVSNLIAQAVVFFFNFFMRKKIVYTLMSKEEDIGSQTQKPSLLQNNSFTNKDGFNIEED